MHISSKTFLSLLAGHTNEIGDMRAFLDECMPMPSATEYETLIVFMQQHGIIATWNPKDKWILDWEC